MGKSSINQRRVPKQARAHATIDVILEAAAQIIERHGEAALTTNRIAERGGVSIGSVYQYFSDKQAILRAIARRADEGLSRAVKNGAVEVGNTDEAVRLAIRSYVSLLKKRHVTREAALKSVLDSADPRDIGKSTDAVAYLLPAPEGASRLDAFVLTRAITGIVRSAVLEGFDGLHTEEFEDALVRVVTGYRRLIAEYSVS